MMMGSVQKQSHGKVIRESRGTILTEWNKGLRRIYIHLPTSDFQDASFPEFKGFINQPQLFANQSLLLSGGNEIIICEC